MYSEKYIQTFSIKNDWKKCIDVHCGHVSSEAEIYVIFNHMLKKCAFNILFYLKRQSILISRYWDNILICSKFLPKSSQLGIFAVYIMSYSITPDAFIKVILQTPKCIGASLLPLSNVLSSSTCYNWLMITEKLKWQKWPVHAHENSIEGKRIKLLFDCQQFLILAGMDNRYFNDLNVAAFVTGQAEFQTSKNNVKMQ